MVPDKFNMVDLGGIDLIMMQGEAVPGLYAKLMAAISNCQYQCLYNWIFDGVLIPPAYVQLTDNDGEIYLNEGVSVTSDDVIHIYSIEPGPVDPEIIPLLAEENGTYTIPSGVDGFNPVTVDVPSYTPVIEPISITENGTYTAPAGKDGYSPVTVNVPSSAPVIEPISITANGTYTAPAGTDGYSPVTVNVPSFTPVIEPITITANGTYTAPAGKDGYNPVTVNVSSVAGKYLLQTPLHYDFIGGYVAGGDWRVGDTASRTDIYQVYAGKHYIIHLGSTVGNRFRSAFFTTDPALATVGMSGTGIYNGDNPSSYANCLISALFSPSSDGFVAIGKTNQSVNGLKSYLVDFEESN